MTTPLQLLPAVDVQDGQAVRLVQGEYGTATNYGDPFDAALGWQEAGAEWLHLVDLDAAFGHGNNREIIRRITGELGIKIELSGGLRDDASLEEAFEMGATRVNLGTAALENPEWTAKVISQHGDKIAVGLDVRGEKLATRGWVEEGGHLWDVLDQLEAAGCARYVVTDITKDGTLTGPNTELLGQIAQKTGKPVIASGGISVLDDIAELTQMVDQGIEGAIIGKALYAGQFTLQQALQVASGSAVKDV
ncbi:bifunctional 1-(5-phosphoribosyl)-5-((5-phosphoribosylamino)methylideneamino)imidazole-4-carboxamide isomerase/phosphoribosylanthranilate isomerase PriA [Enteractinococcus coprophilus]|uniref:1-(5-phosphoribosyl)-5-[(5-phosphoribosylamino)methylideneamino] imidazole-4-carboxamide isomerase n=1 Tax=Enteractinococcus coprophilus TaxID=1027633 RepID=A0A543AJZ9_9MICC|nr:bifunctional 1-(5-phosphoribosyl)-5-((5-phosphoribosylamino)methylideneamino)imidazole-4-carboxamide isomerase/phosphoribosylanthranilate isomerase PriA [Enteractinococcus coprophilus]TQL72915.1 1-(5-phosphoribosyl)-5-[(5-phosphoribosylamino)methylideneamino] imidazole-4-carboxamide isomerase [Enteractinococcus coprophilus]